MSITYSQPASQPHARNKRGYYPPCRIPGIAESRLGAYLTNFQVGAEMPRSCLAYCVAIDRNKGRGGSSGDGRWVRWILRFLPLHDGRHFRDEPPPPCADQGTHKGGRIHIRVGVVRGARGAWRFGARGRCGLPR